MRQYLILIVGLILSITAFTSVLAAQRVALIIGNSAYKTAPLANPVNDAKDMAKALKKLGFQVIELSLPPAPSRWEGELTPLNILDLYSPTPSGRGLGGGTTLTLKNNATQRTVTSQ